MESASNSNNSRFTLALCEIHNTRMHGKDASSTPGIEGHYIASVTFDPEEFYTNDWRAVCAMMRSHYATNPSLKNHNDHVLAKIGGKEAYNRKESNSV